MSRPSPAPRERMKEARDFLYWLNHCTWTHHTHDDSSGVKLQSPLTCLRLNHHQRFLHMIQQEVMSHSPPLHTCGSGRWRAARCRTPSAELWSSAAGRIWGDRNIIIIFNKQNNTQVMWCSGEQVSRCEVVTGRLWGSAGSSAGSSDAVWWRESAQLDLQTSPRYWRKIRF